MPNSLPPLRALVAFEAALRHASFKQAAEELHLTPGAVSQQVQKLEQWLGQALFVRTVRQLQPTEHARSYYSRIAPALEQISSASATIRNQSTDVVCLSLAQTLAVKWLGPRLGDFASHHPDIEIHINASNHLVDFRQEAVDLAIRYFDGQDASLETELLYQDVVQVFCTPEYARTLALQHPDQLTHATLIVASIYPYWDDWLAAFSNITPVTRKRINTLYFDQTLLAIDAARRGQGVVLSNALLVQEELHRGQLVSPFPCQLARDQGYYLVYPRQYPLSQAARKLRDWLLTQRAPHPWA
ncbi:MAG: LysR family transcriptional regulator [Thiothrix sp.]|nr:LysR family transcriptional regulator [Thiothrix sp.]